MAAVRQAVQVGAVGGQGVVGVGEGEGGARGEDGAAAGGGALRRGGRDSEWDVTYTIRSAAYGGAVRDIGRRAAKNGTEWRRRPADGLSRSGIGILHSIFSVRHAEALCGAWPGGCPRTAQN